MHMHSRNTKRWGSSLQRVKSGYFEVILGYLISPHLFSSSLRAAALLVELHFVLDPIVQLKVVVLQGGGRAWRQAAVWAGAVKEEAGTHGTQKNTQRAHDNDRQENGVQRVQPRVVLVDHACHRRLWWRFGCAPLWKLETYNSKMRGEHNQKMFIIICFRTWYHGNSMVFVEGVSSPLKNSDGTLTKKQWNSCARVFIW